MASSLRRTIHGNLVSVFGFGVLIVGDSGTGKTACSVFLLKRGHRLIADDVVEIAVEANCLTGKCPDQFRGLANVAENEIVDLRRLFPARSFLACSRIDMIVRLLQPGDRSGDPLANFFDLSVPVVNIEAAQATELAKRIEAAARNASAAQPIASA